MWSAEPDSHVTWMPSTSRGPCESHLLGDSGESSDRGPVLRQLLGPRSKTRLPEHSVLTGSRDLSSSATGSSPPGWLLSALDGPVWGRAPSFLVVFYCRVCPIGVSLCVCVCAMTNRGPRNVLAQSRFSTKILQCDSRVSSSSQLLNDTKFFSRGIASSHTLAVLLISRNPLWSFCRCVRVSCRIPGASLT